MGKELYDYLVDFNGKIRPISEEMSEDIYNNLIDIDLIEEYICYFKIFDINSNCGGILMKRLLLLLVPVMV